MAVAAPPAPPPVDTGHWTAMIAEGQRMMAQAGFALPPAGVDAAAAPAGLMTDLSAAWWRAGLDWWDRALGQAPQAESGRPAGGDRRLAADAWRDNPFFDWMRQSYLALAERMLAGIDALDGVDERQKEQLRFGTRALLDAANPANFLLTNPQVIERAIETRGESLLAGLSNLLADLGRGQLTHSPAGAFEVGRNLATTPGKVIKRTPLYELIQYAPTTERVLATPLVIFPPWINRYYILDLTPEKSFVRWATAQGVSVFMVSWKSADATMKDVVWDDYVAAQIDAIDTVRELLDVPSAHAIGYCVAGTTLAATLALLAARGEAGKVTSATFFTAQVDFSSAGDLAHFIGDDQLALIGALSPDGYLDGRFMAATFNLLRGRDLIWNYVTDNYLLGKEHRPFDLLHWNGDTTNLPARWHLSYLTDLYRDNRLVRPGSLSVDGTPLDLTQVRTPTYVQAGREDHIAPAASVWKLTHHFAGPIRFVLAGSGHIAGVVNPPGSGKYGYWLGDAAADSLDAFVAGASEHKGSWWPDWIAWLSDVAPDTVAVAGARRPGDGALPALAEAPGDYARAR